MFEADASGASTDVSDEKQSDEKEAQVDVDSVPLKVTFSVNSLAQVMFVSRREEISLCTRQLDGTEHRRTSRGEHST